MFRCDGSKNYQLRLLSTIFVPLTRFSSPHLTIIQTRMLHNILHNEVSSIDVRHFRVIWPHGSDCTNTLTQKALVYQLYKQHKTTSFILVLFTYVTFRSGTSTSESYMRSHLKPLPYTLCKMIQSTRSHIWNKPNRFFCVIFR